jgi:hypothetical protein
MGACLNFSQHGSFLSLDWRSEGKALGAGDAIFQRVSVSRALRHLQ